jgi:hypothetical protein
MVFLVVFSPQNRSFCPILAVFRNNEVGLATYFLRFEKFNGFLHPSSLAIFQQNPRHYLADGTKLKAFFKKP